MARPYRGGTLSDRLVARAREMHALLVEIAGRSTGKLKARITEVTDRADKDIPRLKGRHIRTAKFKTEDVRQVLEKHGGDKQKAADELGCSVRTVYAAINREE